MSDQDAAKQENKEDKNGCGDPSGCVDGCFNLPGCVGPDGCEGCLQIMCGIVCGIYWLAVQIGHFLAHHVPHM